jgi:nicotinamide-nucleotide amidase
MVINAEALDNIKRIFEKILKRPLIERNQKQAEVPDCCTVIQNKLGTAPGMWFEKEGKVFVSMPGVPHEMKGMMTNSVIPALSQKFKLPHIGHRTLLTFGIGESFLADHIASFESALPSHIKLAYLPNFGIVRLRLSSWGDESVTVETELDRQFESLKELVSEWLVISEDKTLQEAIGQLLKDRSKTIGTAESCTGGYIAHLLTGIPGSSAYFKGSIVSYSNEIKETLLGVSSETLDNAGAVSEETVRQMAGGALEALQTDFVIVTSGIMGPDGGTAEKPVGTVWIAVGNKDTIIANKYYFRFDRLRNIELTANTALNQARILISGSLKTNEKN